MARPERFELPTTWFVARYSIQLSYGRVRRRDYSPNHFGQKDADPGTSARCLCVLPVGGQPQSSISSARSGNREAQAGSNAAAATGVRALSSYASTPSTSAARDRTA